MANPARHNVRSGVLAVCQPARPNSPSEQALRLIAVSKLFINDGILTDNRRRVALVLDFVVCLVFLTSAAHLKLTDTLMQRYSRKRRCSDCRLSHSDCVTSIESTKCDYDTARYCFCVKPICYTTL